VSLQLLRFLVVEVSLTPLTRVSPTLQQAASEKRVVEVSVVEVSLTPLTRVSPTLQQAASEKRQGTKSREVGQPTLQQRLWGFRRPTVAENGVRKLCGWQ
jgi:hypothetical protein